MGLWQEYTVPPCTSTMLQSAMLSWLCYPGSASLWSGLHLYISEALHAGLSPVLLVAIGLRRIYHLI